ncbi:MAG: amidohydrolase family protein [Alphaproteobacteria bacterium]|nr:amidohydrolase family protein [Alphaproteobacteria bacterium]
MSTTWDLLFKGARVYDGAGGASVVEDVAIAGGRVAARGADLPEDRAARVLDARGLWLMPGLVDVHTHYDLEVELAPALSESLRHGTTTVVMSNCSLGLAFGNQRHTGSDPIVDCFARVENIPKPVLAAAGDVATWTRSSEYLEHLGGLALGPNVVTMIPHSMLRIEVMGLEAAITRDPTPSELERMCDLLEQGMREGYAGFSTDALPFHYLANDPNRKIKIPTQHAGYAELKALTAVVRRHDRVWQTTPPKDNPLASFRNFLLSSGRLHGRPLKVTAVAALDVVPNRMLFRLGRLVATIINSSFFRGRFHLQALAARFKVWSDGPITPLAEEVPVLRELNEFDLEQRAERTALVADAGWQRRFRAWWTEGRTPFTIAWLRRLIRYEDTQFTRQLADMVFDQAPVPQWTDETFEEVYSRLLAFQGGDAGVARSDVERDVLAAFPAGADEAGFLIHLLQTFDTDLTWWCVSANEDEATVKRILMDERFLPGFSDAGAHITNMAFYDANLRALRHAQADGDAAVGRMVHRLTAQPCDLFGVDAGSLAEGATADVVVVDPTALRAYESEAHVQRVHREVFDHAQLVNRSDGVVRWVVVGGRMAWDEQGATAALGRDRLGRCLTAGGAGGAVASGVPDLAVAK